jgi:diaminopimelate decarboxylase
MQKKLKYSSEFLSSLAEKYPTPFYLYDERTLRDYSRLFNESFSWNAGYREFFAVKANPNPALLQIIKSEGLGGDCSSLPELVICERVGITGESIMFTSNDTPVAEYVKAKSLGAIINLDDISDLAILESGVGLPEVISFRWNPGSLRDVASVIGNPVEAKYGLTTAQLFDAFAAAKSKGIKRCGLHTMVASNMLQEDFFAYTAKTMFEMILEIERKTGVKISFVNLGGGFGVAYKPEQDPLDLRKVGELIRCEYDRLIASSELAPLRIFTESGRLVAAESGVLITRVIHRKNIYKQYVGVDASMANLMRPGMYGAYHHISVVGKSDADVGDCATEKVDVVGSLCENCDKFAVDRVLPKIGIGDLIAIHDTGAHGYSMGFQYNGKLRCAELLLEESGNIKLIRRAETIDDYLATLTI